MKTKKFRFATKPVFLLLLFAVILPFPAVTTPNAAAIAPNDVALPSVTAVAPEEIAATVIRAAEAVVPAVVAPVAVSPLRLVTRLLIPSIGLNAEIQTVGITAGGAMEIPDDNAVVGWYGPGTPVGTTGSAVIGGHNRWKKADGVFVRLHEIQIGAIITVVSETGAESSYRVRETRLFDPADDATPVFTSEAGVHLHLITCSGVWDPAAQSYTKRLVVFTDAV